MINKSYREKVEKTDCENRPSLPNLLADFFDDVECTFAEVGDFAPLFGGYNLFGEEVAAHTLRR